MTLLELLASLVLLTLLTVLTHQMVSLISASSRRSLETVKSRALARTLLDQIAWDLAFAAPPLPNQPANYPRLRLAASSAPHANPHLLLFQTDRGAATLQQIVYFVRTGPPLAFCRATFIPQIGSGGILPLTYENRDHWLTEAFLDSIAPATRASGEQGLLSRSVVSFWARALDHEGRPIRQNAAGTQVGYDFDSDAGYTTEDGDIYPPPAYPPAVEVALVILRDDSQSLANGLTYPTPPPGDPRQFDAQLDAFIAAQNPTLRGRLQIWRRTIPLECHPPR